jgi:hypothetical protein
MGENGNSKTLGVAVPRRVDHWQTDPVVIDVARRTRRDPLKPYVVSSETDIDDAHYRPGGQRYETAGVVLPDAENDHVLRAVLRFGDPGDVDALIEQLRGVRDLLSEKFTAAHFEFEPAAPVEV